MKYLERFVNKFPDIKRGVRAGLEVEILNDLSESVAINLPSNRLLVQAKKHRLVNQALFDDLLPEGMEELNPMQIGIDAIKAEFRLTFRLGGYLGIRVAKTVHGLEVVKGGNGEFDIQRRKK